MKENIAFEANEFWNLLSWYEMAFIWAIFTFAWYFIFKFFKLELTTLKKFMTYFTKK